ncbi:hypothetical protein PMIN03_008617 [Paraphaeosphaeria minitans]
MIVRLAVRKGRDVGSIPCNGPLPDPAPPKSEKESGLLHMLENVTLQHLSPRSVFAGMTLTHATMRAVRIWSWSVHARTSQPRRADGQCFETLLLSVHPCARMPAPALQKTEP